MRAVVIMAVVGLGCGTGIEEGPVVLPTAEFLWEETFDSPESLREWTIHAHCQESMTGDWRIDGGLLEVTGNCRLSLDDEVDKLRLGTWARHQTREFGEGWLVADLLPDDDDSWGLLWGPELAYHRFSLFKDGASALFATVAAPGANFVGERVESAPATHRFQVQSYFWETLVPLGVWTEVAIERTRARTTAYIDRVPVLWFEGDPMLAGPIGIYAWGMTRLAVDRMAVYAPGPPPWERGDVPRRTTPRR